MSIQWTVVPVRKDNPVLFKIVDETGEQVVPFTWEDELTPQKFCDAHNAALTTALEQLKVVRELRKIDQDLIQQLKANT